jgi:site-specific recombinase XerD
MSISNEDFEKFLSIHNYSRSTIIGYTKALARMCVYCQKKPHQLNEFDFKEFTEHLVFDTNLSWNAIHAYHGAFSCFFRRMLNNTAYKQYVRYPKRHRILPEILSYSEVHAIFKSITNPKHKTIIKLFYSTGIRQSELRHLTVDCIDFERRTIKIIGGKGRKDRYVAISSHMQLVLAEYLELYKPTAYLFKPNSNNPYFRHRSVQYIINLHKNKLNLKKKICIHTLRHTYATHMLEQGGNILTLQRLLGHSTLNATLVYLHTQNVDILKAPNPLDNLEMLYA